MNHENFIELISGYALDTLDVEERRRLEAHLAECAQCRAELDTYRSVVSGLGFAAEVRDPSPRLRERVLAWRPAADAEARGEVEIEEPDWRAGLRRLLPGSRWATFATTALVVGLVIWNVWLRVQIGELNGRIEQLNRRLSHQSEAVVLLALDKDTGITMQGTEAAPNAMAQLIPHPSRQGATLVVRDLPPLPRGRVYQLWLIRPNGQRDSGGTFIVEGEDTVTYIHPPADIGEYVAVGVTDEPAGGSSGPTGTKVLGGEL